MARMSFNAWMNRVSEIVFGLVGIDADDLPDVPYRDWYDDNVTPRVAATWALLEAGFDDELE